MLDHINFDYEQHLKGKSWSQNRKRNEAHWKLVQGEISGDHNNPT